jgi:flagellar hook-associated protein 3 FlgL
LLRAGILPGEVLILRVTDKIITNGVARNINSSMRRIDKRYDELSSGKKIRYPSDDPVRLISSLRLNDSINEARRYVDNSNAAMDWLNASDASLDEMNKTLLRLQTIAIAAANGDLPQSSFNAYADEVHQLRAHILQVANTQLGNRFLFAGQQTNRSAYDGNYNYMGDDNPVIMEVGPGIALEVSYPGSRIFANFFEVLDKFEKDIRNADFMTVGREDLKAIKKHLDRTLDNRASIGAKVNRLERSNERYSQLDVQFHKLLSENEDVDIADSVMNLKMQESVYQAALASGARVMQTNMLNYMR